jgi:hypothetical protein
MDRPWRMASSEHRRSWAPERRTHILVDRTVLFLAGHKLFQPNRILHSVSLQLNTHLRRLLTDTVPSEENGSPKGPA